MEIKVTVDIPSVQALADALRYVADKEHEPIPYTPTVESEPEKESDIPPEYTLEQVRAQLAALAQAGKQKRVKELITSFDVKKLTDIPESKYPVLMEKAEKIS